MNILDIKKIHKRLKEYIENPFNQPEMKGFYLPFEKPDFVSKCIEVLYQASFLKEEGRPLIFRVFLGDFKHLSPTKRLYLADDFKLENNIIDLTKQGIEFNPESIKKLAPAASPNDFTILVFPRKTKLKIQGLLYCQFPVPADYFEIPFYPYVVVDKIDFKGLIFECNEPGHLHIWCRKPVMTLKAGKVEVTDDSRTVERFFTNTNPLDTDLKNLFRVGFDNSSINESFLSRPILKALRLISQKGIGGTIIFSTNETYLDLKNKKVLTPKYEVDISFGDTDYHDTRKLDFWNKRITDLLFGFSKTDGAIVVTEKGIKCFGTKIDFEPKNIPVEYKNRGTRHQSAVSLVNQYKKGVYVCEVSSDGEITYVRPEESGPQIYFSNGFEFKTDKKELPSESHSSSFIWGRE